LIVQVIRDLESLPPGLRSGAVAIGNFDGVHVGHARILDRLVAKARQLRAAPVVFTFDPPAAAILRPGQAPPLLTSTVRKAQLLAAIGVEALVAYPTDEAFLSLAPRAFFDQIVVRRLEARALVEGYSFFFGRGRAGNVETLAEFCREAGISMEVVEPVHVGGQAVSSSRIRALIAEGRVEEARRMLARPHRIRGMVIHGAGRGRKLGYPTANLDRVDTLLPAGGIYAGLGQVDGDVRAAAISVGPNPTFGEGALKVEVHLIDYDGWLYDRHVDVDFLARLRDIQRFDSIEELVRQMDQDIAAARRIAAQPA
jgi:riboflavin kinase/FMN adenylyltransferase